MLRRFWLFFAQAVTVVLAVLFVIATLKPEWLQRGKAAVQSGSPIVALKEVAPLGHSGTSSNSYAEAAKVAMPAVVNIFSSKNAPKRNNPQANADPWFRFFSETVCLSSARNRLPAWAPASSSARKATF